MGLYERVMRFEAPKIPVHTFYAMMTERRRGHVTNQQIITQFSLSAAEQAELTSLANRVNANQLTGPEIHEVLLLAEQRVPPYDTAAAVRTRLGV